MLPQPPQSLLDLLVGLLCLPRCAGATLGGLGQFLGPATQLLRIPFRDFLVCRSSLLNMPCPLCVLGHFTGSVESDRAQFFSLVEPWRTSWNSSVLILHTDFLMRPRRRCRLGFRLGPSAGL